MEIGKILQLNTEYDNKKRELELEFKRLEQINSKLNFDELRKMTYDKVKDVRERLKYRIASNDVEKKLDKLYQEKRYEKYPILKVAYYFPVINQLDYLTDEDKRKLDKRLEKMKLWNCNEYDIVSHINGGKDNKFKLIQFLIDNDIVERGYLFSCNCGDNSGMCDHEYKSEKELEEFKEYYSKNVDDMTDEEYDKWEDDWEKIGYISVGCWNDSEVEICSILDLENARKREVYKVIGKADYTYENV